MPRQRLSVSIPQPCHEAWHAMTPQGQGRFCQSCSKTVTDFTAMSDAEMVQWLSQNKEASCGRFRKDQIGKELVAISVSKKRWTWQAVMLGLSAWLSTKTVETKASQIPPIEQTVQNASFTLKNSEKTSILTDSTQIIKGVVVDADDKLGLPGVSIQITDTQVSTPTNMNGEFELKLPEGANRDQWIVTFQYVGYVSQEIKLAELLQTKQPVIHMAPDIKGGFEAVICNRFSPRNLIYKIKALFR